MNEMKNKAAPASVAVPAKLPTSDEIRAIARSVSTSSSDSPSPSEYVMAGYRAALAATPAAEVMKYQTYPEAEKSLAVLDDGQRVDIGVEIAAAAAPVVLPETDAAVTEVMGLVQDYFVTGMDKARSTIETKLRALLATATGLPAQACIATLTVDSSGNLDYETAQAGWLLPEGVHQLYAAPQAQADALDAEQEVLMEHSGCGSNTQVDMLTVRLNPGDKVVMHKGRITQGFDRANRAAIAAAKGNE